MTLVKNIRKALGWCWSQKIFRVFLISMLVLFCIGFLLPERLRIPVAGASPSDWNHQSFWYYPWGKSGVHKGIDIFSTTGKPVVSSVPGLVVSTGNGPRSGLTVLVLGPKWRFHYYGHLNSVDVSAGDWVSGGQILASVGSSGNAAGKQPHLHYTIATPLPYPWRVRGGPQGWKRMFFLDPHQKLTQ